jgi:hypothetical protein
MSSYGRRCSSNRRTTAGTGRSPAGWRDRILRVERVGDDGQGDGNRCGPAWRGDADNADDLLGRWFGVVVGATSRLGELRRGEAIPWRVIAAQIAPGERRGSR